MTAPRLFGITATAAPVVAVLRRGPTDWFHVGRWDLDAMRFEPGAWLRGTLYPQRCDLSPDGRWLSYVALKSGTDWAAGGTYIALSRLPWLTALAAWGTCGTWTRGLHFVADTGVWPAESPDEGDAAPCRERYGLAFGRAEGFAVERRRGWTETPDTPPRAADDAWDERRAETVVMQKPDPTRPSRRLLVQGGFAAFRAMGPEWYGAAVYSLADDGDEGGRARLDGVQWADWAPDGRLLVATVDGRLQCRSPDDPGVGWEQDLATLVPDPQPAPPEAHRW